MMSNKPNNPLNPDDDNNGDGLPPMVKAFALEAAGVHLRAENDRLSAAIGWAIANAHAASTPGWKIEVMARAGWIPAQDPTLPFPKGGQQGN